MGTVDDELAIRNVLARLAQLADAGDVDAYVALMTDDVVWEMPDNPTIGLAGSIRRGHDEIAAGARARIAAGHQGPGSATLHWVGTIAVSFDGPGAATAGSCFQFFTTTDSAPTLTTVGRYADRFRKVDGSWLLAHRTITMG